VKTPRAGRAQLCSDLHADLPGCPIAGEAHLQPDRRARWAGRGARTPAGRFLPPHGSSSAWAWQAVRTFVSRIWGYAAASCCSGRCAGRPPHATGFKRHCLLSLINAKELADRTSAATPVGPAHAFSCDALRSPPLNFILADRLFSQESLTPALVFSRHAAGAPSSGSGVMMASRTAADAFRRACCGAPLAAV
jgi:hypothetical protein